jgi:hypothetical protein
LDGGVNQSGWHGGITIRPFLETRSKRPIAETKANDSSVRGRMSYLRLFKSRHQFLYQSMEQVPRCLQVNAYVCELAWTVPCCELDYPRRGVRYSAARLERSVLAENVREKPTKSANRTKFEPMQQPASGITSAHRHARN